MDTVLLSAAYLPPISDHGEWRRQHWNALESAYMNSPFFMYYQDDFRPFYEKKYEFLIDFNTELTLLIMKLAGINKSVRLTESYTRQTENIKDLRNLIEPDNNQENPTLPLNNHAPHF